MEITILYPVNYLEIISDLSYLMIKMGVSVQSTAGNTEVKYNYENTPENMKKNVANTLLMQWSNALA